MATQNLVIPEVTQAYQNDPKTALALAALKAGTSTAPVATRGYGYADGAARVVQAIAGALMNKKQEQSYGTDQSALEALENTQGSQGLASLGQSTPPSAPPPMATLPGGGIPLVTGEGSGTPPAAQPIPPGASPSNGASPTAAIPVDPTISAIAARLAGQSPAGAPSQAQGGGQGQPPFGQSPAPPTSAANSPPVSSSAIPAMASQLGSPPPQTPPPQSSPLTVTAARTPPNFMTPEAIPSQPSSVARPNTPTALGPNTSSSLRRAYEMMRDANPYQYDHAQSLMDTGLGEQTKLNEAATARQQALNDMGYQTDLGTYSTATNQDRASTIAQAAAATSRNFERSQTGNAQTFEGAQNAAKLQNALSVANIDASSKIQAARIGMGDDGGGSSASLRPVDLNRMADQYIAGDKSVMSGLGYGKVNAVNRTALNKAITAKLTASGSNGTDMAANIARYVGQTRAAAAAGQRVGAAAVSTSELPLLTNLSSQAYAQLPRGQFVPFNRLQQMYDTNAFSSPLQAKAYAADIGVVSAYARALSPTGQGTDADKKRAVTMLNTAQSPEAHQAVLDQINSETQAIRSGAQAALTGTPPPTAPSGSGWGNMVVH